MKLILHIGFPKTATTVLQRFLSLNSRELEKVGILYPCIDDDFKQRYLKYFYSKPAHNNGIDRKDWVSKTARLKDRIENANADYVLLSCEELANPFVVDTQLSGFEQFRDWLTSICKDVTVIAYVRSLDDYYLSVMQESIKRWPHVVSPARYNPAFRRFLTAFEENFPKLAVRQFSRSGLLGRSIVRDFFDSLDIERGKVSDDDYGERTNESLSAEAMMLLELCRNSPDIVHVANECDRHSRDALWRKVKAIDDHVPDRNPPELKEAARSALRERLMPEADWVRSRFGVDISPRTSLEYVTPEKRNAVSVADIVNVNEARLGTMREILTESRYFRTFADDAGQL